jgi:hypothetical protein
MKRRDAWTAKSDPRKRGAAVTKRIEIVDAPILRESVKGTAPTVAARVVDAGSTRDVGKE